MDTVPALFIESVLQSSGFGVRTSSRQLSGQWGQLGEIYFDQGGTVYLAYAPSPDDRNEWRLHYSLEGWEHIEPRTLNKELAEKISKTIISIRMFMTDAINQHGDGWTSISPQDDEIVHLLTRLEAPILNLNLKYYAQDSRSYGTWQLKCEELIARYSHLLRKFTSVVLDSFEPSFAKLIQDMAYSERLQSIEIKNLVPAILPRSFWVDYFLSDRCRRLRVTFEDTGVVRGIINRWKKMDTSRLALGKGLLGMKLSLEDLEDVGLIPDSEWEHSRISSFHRIDHPDDPSSMIYVTFFKDVHRLVLLEESTTSRRCLSLVPQLPLGTSFSVKDSHPFNVLTKLNSSPSVRPSNPSDMERVPACFIESVLECSGYQVRKESEQLSGSWGRLGEVYFTKHGSVLLAYAPSTDDRNEWRLYYSLSGFDHIKTRTLSREVVKEISKTILSIQLYVSTGSSRNDENWTSIGPQDDNIVHLLTRLDAPFSLLDLDLMILRVYDRLDSKCEELVSRYPHLVRTFASVELGSFRPSFERLIQDMTSSGRLRSIDIKKQVPAIVPSSFWVDYFFSKGCKTLKANFEDIGVVLGVINRWKEMDPQHLAHNKIFERIKASPKDLANVGLVAITEESILKNIQKITTRGSIDSLHRINHPVDPRSMIYVAFLDNVRPSNPSDMERVPACFIESVLRSSGYGVRQISEYLSGPWGHLGEVYSNKCGSVFLRYARSAVHRNEWRLHYDLRGFHHIDTRTLSREVVKEISKSIGSIQLSVSTNLNDEDWTSIGPKDDDIVRLLTRLDAPFSVLGFDVKNLRVYDDFESKCEQLASRYPQLVRMFTTVKLNSFQPLFERLIEDTVSTGRLRSISVQHGLPKTLPTSFWVDYFFSESCQKLSANFGQDFKVEGVINRWKKMDPRRLAQNKIFESVKASPKDLVNVGLIAITEESVTKEIREQITTQDIREQRRTNRFISSFHRIDHPVDPRSVIYVTFFKNGDCSLLFY
uniref:AAA domain-containing protein n=1 Tax=Steinernema glaseri TaxID=37863 RepID=A0A1I7ZZE8_9BILA